MTAIGVATKKSSGWVCKIYIDLVYQYNANTERTTSWEIVLSLVYPAMTCFPGGLRPKYPWPWNERHDSLRGRVSPSHPPQRKT